MRININELYDLIGKSLPKESIEDTIEKKIKEIQMTTNKPIEIISTNIIKNDASYSMFEVMLWSAFGIFFLVIATTIIFVLCFFLKHRPHEEVRRRAVIYKSEETFFCEFIYLFKGTVKLG